MDVPVPLQPGPGPAPDGGDVPTQQQQQQMQQQQHMQQQQQMQMQQQQQMQQHQQQHQQQQQQPPGGATGGGGGGGGGGNGNGNGGFPAGYQTAPGYGPGTYGAAYGGHYPMHPGAYGGGGGGGYQMGMHPNAAAYGGGPYPYGRPPYPYGGYPGDPSGGGGAAGGFYPGQQQRVKQASPGRSSRGGHSSLASPRRNTTTLANAANMKGVGPNDIKMGIVTEEARKKESMEIERLRKAAEKDLSQTDVKPIQSDFHFFAADMRDKLKVAAEEEVRQVSKSEEEKLDMYLVNSSLNCRLMKAWEDLTVAEREVYAKKEQEDRRRFMQDDEIASRHCATLTARARSPGKKGPANEDGGEHDAEEEGDAKRQPEKNEEDLESPSKKNRLAEVEV
jgi:hypothetical protein